VQARTKIKVGAGVVVAAVLVIWMSASRSDRRGSASGAGSASASGSTASLERPPNPSAGTPPLEPNAVITDASAIGSGANALVVARWGSARGELGRERPQEGNPEGPMSLVLAGRDLLVLDQVNGRLARFDRDGRLLSTSDAPTTAQDLAVAKDGTVAMIDRLVGKEITLVDPSGKKIGALPLSRLPEPGLVTAVVVDGKDVYVEKEHGSLILIGSTDGKPADDAVQLSGRPSKDGALLLTAGLSSKPQGRAYLNAFDRKTQSLRFARTILFPKPTQGIVLLDSDAKGTLYLGVAAGEPGDAHLACLDPSDGRVIGRVMLPLSHTPEESFRDFTVGDDGTIAFAVRTDDGVQYRTARCP
jgi:sugar lactone lactonase YvrE